MVLSDVSIKRPVFATVISLMLTVLGLFALQRMPIREYPKIDPPVIQITTTYRGASAPVVDSQITEILEAAVAGIEGVKLMSSQSRDERSQITLEFLLSRDVDAAANDVRDRVARALARLPEQADTPVVAKVDGDSRPILWIALASDRLSPLDLTDVARRRIVDRLAIVEGVAQVIISGERRFSMRIWLDRQALAARGLTVQDVEDAIRRENVELPGGRIESTARELTVRTDTRMSQPEQFREIVIARGAGGAQVLLGEVARVEIGAEDNRGAYRINGRPAIGLGILRQSTANTLSVAEGVKAEMERIRPSLPEGIDVIVGYDESLFISQSIYEVKHALLIALASVIGVIFLFLRSLRATIIPAMAIPVSIIASFIAMAALGFSVNVLTLLGLVLAIGLVVDDAIVVLENIHRRIEEGEEPLLASLLGAREIAFAVIATTLVLVAVFVPLSFMGGNTGRLFVEFGLALAASVVFSGLVALTLTPMMCSKLLKPHEGETWLVRVSEPVFVGMNNALRWTLDRALRAPLLVLGAAGLLSALAVALYSVLPKEFAPTEDRGVVIIPTTGPEGASFAYTMEHVMQIERLLQRYVDSGEARAVFATVGGFQRPAIGNVANVFVRLAPWAERERKQQEIAAEIFPQVAAVPGVRAFALNPASLGQRGFQPPVQFVIGGPDYDTLVQWRDRFLERARQNPRLLNLDHNFKETKPEVRVQIDRRKAADLGISIAAVGRTIETMLGSREVTSYVVGGQEYKVLLQAPEEARLSPYDLQNVFVRTGSGGLVPLANVVTLSERARAQTLAREDRVRAITITASLAPGYSLGDALDFLDGVAREVLPSDARIAYRGQSLEFRESSGALYVTFAMALLVVFLVLAAQFESFVHPLIILLSTPLAVTGGLFGLWWTGQSLNVFSQIGMILLIGLMAKNGILVVEFANQLRDRGLSVRDAVLEASVVRLRPILMTSIATVLGALPLAMATGAGAESRMALGTVIAWGISVSTFVTLYAVPALYLLLAPYTRPIGAIAARLADLESSRRPGHGTQPAE
ncbi:efflux RND transporter permease subunit [Roseomonas alkaliterrae]|uniref:Multidrug efflux pump n=1 Tax=Neoroseomonas alkaliterrae TaxID=1452450 RepID=A0A840XN40_9PROT|nr:efflux RND transporter permease subunit [Neoroseomonas alkaliterrae]MBB5689998.1 multidrug efflux pump [Neoroseomonas alkaliterrae]MBR0675524.1 efflux RND transporter permease subunit [Neoroseomonas alkaliterrae]